MNKKEIGNMLNAVVRLSPAPVLVDDRGKTIRTLEHWRVSGYVGEGRRRRIQIETISQGFALRLFFDCIIEFQEEDLYYPSVKQGVLLLKAQWVIRPEGKTPRRVPIHPIKH